MNVQEITSQHELDGFIGSEPRSQFLQSWWWGEFQRQLPTPIIRLGVFDHERLLGSAQIIVRALPLGRQYWYMPRGPVVSSQLSRPPSPAIQGPEAFQARREAKPMAGAAVASYQTTFRKLLEEIMTRADKAGVMFVRCEPPMERASQHIFDSLTRDYRRQAAAFVQPQDSLYLDITQPEEKLLSAMHPKTRYNIKLAERKDVAVRTSGAIDDFDSFWKLMETTAKRDRIKPHSRSYYREMYRLFGQSDFMKMFLAEYQGKVIGTNLMVFFGDTATYLHGASADEYREAMAPHLLQWRQIQAAKKRGFKYYDFWGIAPGRSAVSQSDRSVQLASEKLQADWAGISRFKRGFGGAEINYLGAYDLILDAFWYRMYRIVQKVRV
jgi:lipid II:glycine glycyltransferase (peptidoglycan interpeptide bridge formation enzyme)